MKPSTKPMSRKRKSVPAHELAHFRKVAALPCAECFVELYSQCAHSNRSQDGKGARLKANYLATFPLCCARPGVIGCHQTHDLLIGITKEEADARTDRYIEWTHKQLGLT